MPKTLTGAIQEVGLSGDILRRLPVYQDAASHPIGKPSAETVALCYTVGTLTFKQTSEGAQTPLRYGLLDMDVFNLDGVWNGHYLSVWQPQILPTDDVTKSPAPYYTGPWDKLSQAVPPAVIRANGFHRYDFHGVGGTGKGTIYATGPGNLLVTKVAGGGAMFEVSVATYITGGSGEFEGIHGAHTALGSSFVPPGVDVNSLPLDVPVPGATVSTFKYVLKKHQA